MTLLSQSLELLRRARTLLRDLETEGTAPAPLALPAAQPSAAPKALLSVPRLRLAWSAAAEAAAWEAAEGSDNSIRGHAGPVALGPAAAARSAANEPTEAALPGPLSSGAEPFLAGHGARVYSLDVWRRTHPRGRTPHAA
jgi:hypothetical protein